MDLEQLLVEIDHIGHMIQSWKEQGQVTEIERQIILDKLRHIYERLIFSREAEEGQSSIGEAPEPQETGCVDTTGEVDDVAESHSREAEDPIVSPSEESAPKETGAGDNQISATIERVPSVDQKLFNDEPHVRSRVDKRIILSLYGNDSFSGKPVATPAPDQIEEQPPATTLDQQQPTDPTKVVDPVDETTAPIVPEEEPVPHVEIPHKKVLGEALSNPTATVNDVTGKKSAHADVASRLRASQVTDLKHSIGINDRFLLIRDLFDGKAEEYERVIDELNGFATLDDAMIYIQEHFEWDPDSDGATLLVELLERKFEC